jgi:hypothetical protein
VNGQSAFPIENAQKSLFLVTSLKHKSSDEVNMYSCGVRFGEINGWPIHTLLLSPDIQSDAEASLEDA